MIRRIIGAAFDTAMRKERTLNEIIEALAKKDPRQELPNAKPHGLLLRNIRYKNLRW